jgi:hypothetical protein
MQSGQKFPSTHGRPDLDIKTSDVVMLGVRTTLDIDDSVLAAAKETAEAQHTSAGAVISEWARKGLQTISTRARRTHAGFPIFDIPGNAEPLTTAAVASIVDNEGLPPRR